MKKIMIFVAAMIVLVGCGNKDERVPALNSTIDGAETQTELEESKDDLGMTKEQVPDYPFEYKDVVIHMNTQAEPIIKALGEPMKYFEAPSCAFQGLDKIYYYNGFELSTYPFDGVDFISAVNLMDDSVGTAKKICIGASLEEVTNAYGKEYTEESGLYTYSLGESELTFLLENNEVTAITYMAIVDGVNE